MLKISFKKALSMLLAAVLISCGAMILAEDQNEAVQTSAIQKFADPVEQFRTERQQLRAMQKAQLNDIAHDTAAEAETRELARRQLIEICENEEAEMTIEGILSMRGFVSPVVTVHHQSVNVIVRAEMLTKEQSSVILDLVSRESGALSGDIKIIPIN